MNDSPEILALKATIFDIMARQEMLQQQFNQLEQDKQSKLTDLRAAISAPTT